MKRRIKHYLLALPFVLSPSIAMSAYLDVPCPPPQPNEPPGCKVLVLTPFEQNILVGPNQILDTAKQGRPLDLTNATDYFRHKIEAAPAGKPFGPDTTTPPAGDGLKHDGDETKGGIHLPPKK